LGGARRRGLVLWLSALLMVTAPVVAAATVPVDDYASYEPQTTCRSQALPGTKALARWVDRSFAGGTARASIRACTPGTSEHKDGRAIDWSMSATSARDRATVKKFLDRLLAADAEGTPHARARRMGVMYVIWNDRMYAAYRGFEPRAYLSSSCTSLRTCSRTLRHRDHVHISLSENGGRGLTSWYAGRL
jgi:hypothetical protein